MVEKEDRRWLIITSIVLLFLTSIPYIIGFFRQGMDWHFTGFIFGVEDGNSYIAKMLSGSYGSWLFKSPYSAMPQKGILAFLPYILLGKLAFPPELHDQLVSLLQLFRWAAGGLLIVAVYSFSGLFLKNRLHQRLATLVIILGGGLGWLGWMLFPNQWTGRLPLEVYSPEAFGFLSFLGLPHLAAARAFLLFGLIYFLKDLASGNWLHNSIRGGLCWLVVGLFQPLTIVVGYGILGCYLLITFFASAGNKWQTSLPVIKKALIMGTIASPWVIYNLLFFSSDSYLKIWYAQNIIDSPPILHYLWSYGIFLAASIPAVIQIIKLKDQRTFLLPAWLMCAALLAYFPYNVQRRFIDGVWIALVLLLFLSFEIFKDKRWNIIYPVLLGSTAVAPLLVMLVVTQGVFSTIKPVYRLAKEVTMFEEMAKVVHPDDIILTSYETGNAIPAWVPVFVLAGHGPESANLKQVLPEVEAFYSGGKDLIWQRDFISRNGVDFIIAGPNEKVLGLWETRYGEEYVKIYDQGEYQVYKVEHVNE